VQLRISECGYKITTRSKVEESFNI